MQARIRITNLPAEVTISAEIVPQYHAMLSLAQAGWRLSARLNVPDNITIDPLPPK